MAVPQPESPKRGRVMSFGSNKSGEKTHKSSGSHDLEPRQSRDSHRMRTHADPTLAISEMQPCMCRTDFYSECDNGADEWFNSGDGIREVES